MLTQWRRARKGRAQRYVVGAVLALSLVGAILGSSVPQVSQAALATLLPLRPTPAEAVATPTDSPTPSAAIASETATPSDTPEPTPTATLPTLDPQAEAEFGPCLTTVLGSGSGGRCALLVQQKLSAAGFYKGSVAKRIGVSQVNAVLNYQRSRGLKATGTTTAATWMALATGQPEVPETLPGECTVAGVVLCVDQAHRTLKYVKNGEVVKTIRIRLGGWAQEPKTGKWRLFLTANGTFRVYDKKVSPPSDNYGSGAMPYSVIFYPDMYVHYSPGFASVGYAASSHGCVNVGSLAEAKWVYANTPVGARVHIFGLVL